MRDARPGDAEAVARVWSAAAPLLVRSAARAAADIAEDAVLGRRRWVAELDGVVVGTASVRDDIGPDRTEHDVKLSVEVHPDAGSRGVGTALITAALASLASEAGEITAVCNDDPIALAFAVRNNFVPDGEHRVASVDPHDVPDPGLPPPGLRASTLAVLGPEPVRLAYNAAAGDDPSRMSRPQDAEHFRKDWWESPDHAPDLSWALVDESGPAPVVAAFTTVNVDRAARRAWTSMTATRADLRDRGLARWVKQKTMRSLADVGISVALTANDATNAAMIAVNDSLGYHEAGRLIRVVRRVLR